jgi:hypothetical protein
MNIKLENLKEYVQKSKMFLYPLLDIPRHTEMVESYLGIKGLTLCEGNSLVLLYHNESDGYPEILKQLQKNKFFDFYIKDEEFDIIVFDLSPIKFDYNRVLNGEYSKLSRISKINISVNSGKDGLSAVGIHPEYYYKQVAVFFDCDEDLLVGKELIAPPDMMNEMLTVNKKLFSLLTVDYQIPIVISDPLV